MSIAETEEGTPAKFLDGSPVDGESFYLAVGKLGRPHGVRGELRMLVFTDFPERLHTGKTVYVGDEHVPQRIRSLRNHQAGILIAFQGILDRTEAGTLTNQWVFVTSSELPSLEDGEYYQHQLVDLTVYTEDGQRLGEVVEILETGANDVLVVQEEAQKEILLPMIDDVILDIDLEKKIITVRLIPGLLA